VVRGRALSVRELAPADLPAVRRLVTTSEYVYHRFGSEELPRLLARKPGVAAFSGEAMQAFLLANLLAPPVAWIGGFGLTWSEGQRLEYYLDLLLPAFMTTARRLGVESLYYTGGNVDADWLKDALVARDFHLLTTLRSYDKEDFSVPTEGDQSVEVRPFEPEDLDELLVVEAACFAQHWRYDAVGFLEIADSCPYFVVVVLEGRVVGYQFNIVEAATGFLVRIAVHPAVNSRGIGARLMAEAVHFFAEQRVWKIALNTEEANHHAHRLYEWFGFHQVMPRGFVLERSF
jgi:ribosomal-protein-alanine N-acetyltransferase